MPLESDRVILTVDDTMRLLDAAEDALPRVELLINAVSRRVERFCNTIFRMRRLRLLLDGVPSAYLDLGGPIVTVHSVNFEGTPLIQAPVTAWITATYDYRTLADGRLLRSAGWGSLPASIDVDATLGYDPIPADVIEACNVIIRERHTDRGGDLKSESIGGYSYERFDRADAIDADIPMEAKELLLPYRRWALG